MKNRFKGFSKVFSFTFLQHVKSKGYKNVTVITAILLFLIPAVIIAVMGSFELKEIDYDDNTVYEENTGYDDMTDMSSLKQVIMVCSPDKDALRMTELSGYIKENAGYDMEVVSVGTDFEIAKEEAKSNRNSLIMVVEENAGMYEAHIIIPEDSEVTEEAAYEFMYQTDMYAEKMIASISPQSDIEDSHEEIFDSDEDSMKGLLTMGISYFNVMLIYFFVLAYGQGVANSVIMEKNSKLVETFLVSTRPTAIIMGKLVAITSTGILQIMSWILSLIGGAVTGTLVLQILNPKAGMFIGEMTEVIKTIAKGVFSPTGVILALLILAVGLYLYCSLAAIGGALASKPEDLSSTNVIFATVLLLSFFICLYTSISGNPEAFSWLDYVPFTAAMIVPAKILLGAIPIWKMLLSFGIIVFTTLISTILAGKVYNGMILYRGNAPKLSVIIGMLKCR